MLNAEMSIKYIHDYLVPAARQDCVFAQTCLAPLPAARWGLSPSCNGGKHLRAAAVQCWILHGKATAHRGLRQRGRVLHVWKANCAMPCCAYVEVWVPCLEAACQALLVPSPWATRDRFPPHPCGVGAVPCLGLWRGGRKTHLLGPRRPNPDDSYFCSPWKRVYKFFEGEYVGVFS